MLKRLASYLLLRSLKKNFEQIFWVGDRENLPSPDQSLVVYSNHHSYYDGYLAWWFFSSYLKRPYNVWMEELDRFPQFKLLGALPFPPNDAKRRSSTIRKSAHLLTKNPGQVIHFMPEGILRNPEEGIGEFKADLIRFDPILDNKMWLPFVIYISWNGGPKPVAYLGMGSAHKEAKGNERNILETSLNNLIRSSQTESECILEGAIPTQDRWDFSFAKNWFNVKES